jgi:hypothetical protein
VKYKFDFYTQYKQFYLSDKISARNTESVDFWTTKAHEDRMAVGDGILGIGKECYGQVKGELYLMDSVNNKFDSSHFDHIVESGIEIKSGILQVLDCPNLNTELEISLKPGTYGVRVYSLNLTSVNGDSGDDSYKIEIWPQTTMKKNVLKRYFR